MERKSCCYFMARAIMFLLVVFPASQAALSSPWPYLQIYPPVNESDSRMPLYFALMLSFGGDFKSIGALPGVQIALDYVNSQPSILPGYSLHYTLTDSQCNRTVAIDSFFREMIPAPTKVGWVGSGCSIATNPTSELTHFYNITQLSCTSIAANHFEENDLRHYYQILSMATFLSSGLLGIVRTLDWNKVAIITQNEDVFINMMDDFKKHLSDYGIEFTEKVFASADSISGLGADPFDPEARIFIWAMYSFHARALTCEAYKRGLHYPKYQFLMFGWYAEGWLEEPGSIKKLDCTLEERIRTLDYALAVEMLDFNTNASLVTEGGLTLTDFEEQYLEKIHSPINADIELGELANGNVFAYSQHCHEATLALASALHKTTTDLKENGTLNMEAARQAGLSDGETFTLANFSYTNSVILQRMSSNLDSTDFLGITGNRVVFDENGTRPIYSVLVYQFQPGTRAGYLEIVKIGTVSVERNDTEDFSLLSYGYNATDSQIWPEGTPNDGRPEMVIVTVAIPLVVVYCIFSVLGCCLAIVCLAFNFIFRKRKLLRLSSPNLSYLIGIGALLYYMSVFISVIPTTDQEANSAICNLTPNIAAIGFSLCYGTIIMKMIRVWFIFNHPLLRKKFVIKDWHLGVAVFILVVIDLVMTGLYLLLTGLRDQLETDLTPNRENPVDIIGPTAKVYQNFVYQCRTSAQGIVIALSLGYKGFLQVVALVLAFRTRKVNTKTLDDSKYVAASVYVSSIVSAVVIVSAFTLASYINALPATVGAAQLIGTTAILAIVFVPKMVAVYRDEEVFMSSEGSSQQNQYKVTSSGERELEGLRQRVKQLETSLKHIKTEGEEDQEDNEAVPQPLSVGSGETRVHFSDDMVLDAPSSSFSNVVASSQVTE